MARIRTVKPEFFRHRRLYLAEKETGLPLRIAYVGLWTVSDRDGRFRWEPDELKLDCLPYDEIDFSRVLDALATREFIIKYISDDREYGFIPSFSKHQFINNREQLSSLPEPSIPRVGDASGTRQGNSSDGIRSDTTLPLKKDTLSIKIDSVEESKGAQAVALTTRDGRVTPHQIVDAWNEIAEASHLGMVKKITSVRRQRMMARLKDAGGFDELLKIFHRVAASKFCRGEQNGNGHSNWRADLDFVIREEIFVKIIEGKYDDRMNGKGNGYATGPATGIAEGFAAALAKHGEDSPTGRNPSQPLLDGKRKSGAA